VYLIATLAKSGVAAEIMWLQPNQSQPSPLAQTARPGAMGATAPREMGLGSGAAEELSKLVVFTGNNGEV